VNDAAAVDHGPDGQEVLITAASSTMCLEGSDTPKCLIQLGEYTLLEHILAQLFVAGMERVVIIISHFGHEIMEHVKASILFHKLKIEFLNLGEETPYGHARTLLSAREMFSKPFLIHTADHIFDKAIISRMAAFDLEDCVACVLVDTDKKKLVGLPPTAGKVQLSKGNVIQRIGRNLKTFDAIDAGLFLTTGRIFAALEMLAYEKPKFSLAEALNVLRPSYGLKFADAAGDVWLSIETQAQYDRIIETGSIASLSPWPVFVAKDVTAASQGGAPAHRNSKNVFLAVSAADDDSMLRALDTHDREKSHVFEGYVVGVNQLQEVAREEDPLDENTPLLSMPASPRSRGVSGANGPLSPRLKLLRRKSSFLETAEESFVLSIPFDTPTSSEAGAANNGLPAAVAPLASDRNAYLIELPKSSTRRLGDAQQFVLAVPGTEKLYKKPSLMRQLSHLPSDVKDVAVEALELKNGSLALQLLVKHQVPVIGYVLLLTSLVTISSLGAALDMQQGVDPFLKLFWRSTASLLVFLPLATVAIVDQGLPKFTTHMMFYFMACCLGYAVFLMTFLWSLSHTSIGHAYIFNNCHSLIMVLGRLVVGQFVSQYEGIGTGVGIIGGILTTLDHTAPTSTSTAPVAVQGVTLAGDLVALVGAVGGVVYLLTAKRLREQVDVIVLLSGVFIITTLLHFPVFSILEIPFEFSTDAKIGLFGWVQSTHVLTELYVVVVCTLIGTLGYVAVMKYFDPIVISVVMLLEPVLANAMGIAVGVDLLPGWYTFGGAALITLGTMLVIVSNSSHTESIDATEAMSATTATLPKQAASVSNAALRTPAQLV
jgi:drug/metabolite transporter (DMT)-like permease/choline kinase